MSENTKAAKAVEKIDADYSLEAVPESARKGFWNMFFVMVGFTFFSASMSVGAKLGNGLDLTGFIWACIIGGVILSAYCERNGDIGNDLQTLHAGSRGSGHQQAGDDGDNPLIDTEQLGSGDGEHGNAYAEPTDLGEAQQEGGQVGALGTECATAQQVHGAAFLPSSACLPARSPCSPA